jgi:HAD superfamily hydrolase (TIGR01490 family)
MEAQHIGAGCSFHQLENDRLPGIRCRHHGHPGFWVPVAPLAANSCERLTSCTGSSGEVILPAIRPQARALIASHADRGDLCAIITATNEFVTGPIARELGIEHLIATRVECQDGRYTGRYVGTPTYREGKVARLDDWLHAMGHDWESFQRSWFYSDSANDIPLLSRVSDPVATNPDPRLEAHARAQGWSVLRLFE